jgi:hypothetical protein
MPSTTLDGLDGESLKPAQSFDLRFFLTEAELQQGMALLHPIVGNSRSIRSRLICAVCSVICLMGPVLHGWSWGELIHYAPRTAAIVGLAALFCAWCASGIGVNSLNLRMNRVDLDRHIVVSEQGVKIEWNQQTFNYQWKDFVYFRETDALIILRNPGIRFWTIPLRAVPPASQARFLELIHNKLPCRQPYSWSPDSSLKATPS